MGVASVRRRLVASAGLLVLLGVAPAARPAVPVYRGPLRDPASGATYGQTAFGFLPDSRVSDDPNVAWVASGPNGRVMVQWDGSGASPVITPLAPPSFIVSDFLPSGEAVGSGYWNSTSSSRESVRWDSAGVPTVLQPVGTPSTSTPYVNAYGLSPTGVALGEAPSSSTGARPDTWR